MTYTEIATVCDMCACFNKDGCDFEIPKAIPPDCPKGLGRTERQIERDIGVYTVLAGHPNYTFRVAQIVKLAEGKSMKYPNHKIEGLGRKVKFASDSLRWMRNAGIARRATTPDHRWGLAR